jgi:hypothetical protein
MKFKNTMNIKDTFLKLTEYTIPFGEEHTLEKYLPNGFVKDSVGNYYIQIGDSDTLFTTHLDTFSSKYEKVNHIIDGNIIKTDGNTILGGDNKVGTTILLYLIHNKKPGTYYFFIGEEPIISGGLYGSTKIYNENPNFFKNFKRAIAFDRREKGSIITRQMGRKCCSDEFANDLISKFSLPHFIDTTGYYTDTAVFMNTIPECTNISCGVYNEHYNDEYVDIEYVEKLANDVLKIEHSYDDKNKLCIMTAPDRTVWITEKDDFYPDNFDECLSPNIYEHGSVPSKYADHILFSAHNWKQAAKKERSSWCSNPDLKVVIDSGGA